MKHIISFLLSITLFFSFTINTQTAKAFEQNELADCISSGRANPSLSDISEDSIKNYCLCALDLIIDQGKDIKESGYECAKRSFS